MISFKRVYRAIGSILCWRRRPVDVLVWMQESAITDAIIGQIEDAGLTSIFIVNSLQSGPTYTHRTSGGVVSTHRPFLLRLEMKICKHLGYRLLPIALVLVRPIGFLFYLSLGVRYRINSALILNHDMAVVVGVLRRLGIFKRLVFWAGDWWPGNSLSTGLWSNIGANVCFPVSDWLACKLSDLTVNQTEAIANARRRYWGRDIPREAVGFEPPLIQKCNDVGMRARGHKILFMGVTRSDSGLDLVLEALPKVREQIGDVSLKIVGLTNGAVTELRETAERLGLSDFLDCTGLVDYAAYDALLSDCYCGVNVITDPNSFSSKAIPGKILDYFQYLLPSIVSEYAGPVSKTIEENKLGLVVPPTVDSVAAALIEVYEARREYVKSIELFLRTRSQTNFAELVCRHPSENG